MRFAHLFQDHTTASADLVEEGDKTKQMHSVNRAGYEINPIMGQNGDRYFRVRKSSGADCLSRLKNGLRILIARVR